MDIDYQAALELLFQSPTSCCEYEKEFLKSAKRVVQDISGACTASDSAAVTKKVVQSTTRRETLACKTKNMHNQYNLENIGSSKRKSSPLKVQNKVTSPQKNHGSSYFLAKKEISKNDFDENKKSEMFAQETKMLPKNKTNPSVKVDGISRLRNLLGKSDHSTDLNVIQAVVQEIQSLVLKESFYLLKKSKLWEEEQMRLLQLINELKIHVTNEENSDQLNTKKRLLNKQTKIKPRKKVKKDNGNNFKGFSNANLPKCLANVNDYFTSSDSEDGSSDSEFEIETRNNKDRFNFIGFESQVEKEIFQDINSIEMKAEKWLCQLPPLKVCLNWIPRKETIEKKVIKKQKKISNEEVKNFVKEANLKSSNDIKVSTCSNKQEFKKLSEMSKYKITEVSPAKSKLAKLPKRQIVKGSKSNKSRVANLATEKAERPLIQKLIKKNSVFPQRKNLPNATTPNTISTTAASGNIPPLQTSKKTISESPTQDLSSPSKLLDEHDPSGHLRKTNKCSECGFETAMLGVFKRHQLSHSHLNPESIPLIPQPPSLLYSPDKSKFLNGFEGCSPDKSHLTGLSLGTSPVKAVQAVTYDGKNPGGPPKGETQISARCNGNPQVPGKEKFKRKVSSLTFQTKNKRIVDSRKPFHRLDLDKLLSASDNEEDDDKHYNFTGFHAMRKHASPLKLLLKRKELKLSTKIPKRNVRKNLHPKMTIKRKVIKGEKRIKWRDTWSKTEKYELAWCYLYSKTFPMGQKQTTFLEILQQRGHIHPDKLKIMSSFKLYASMNTYIRRTAFILPKELEAIEDEAKTAALECIFSNDI